MCHRYGSHIIIIIIYIIIMIYIIIIIIFFINIIIIIIIIVTIMMIGLTASSARFQKALEAGCVPVVVSDRLTLPFEGIALSTPCC